MGYFFSFFFCNQINSTDKEYDRCKLEMPISFCGKIEEKKRKKENEKKNQEEISAFLEHFRKLFRPVFTPDYHRSALARGLMPNDSDSVLKLGLLLLQLF